MVKSQVLDSASGLNRQTVLIVTAVTLLCTGIVFSTSASLDIAESLTGNPFHFVIRQLVFISLGIGLALGIYQIPMEVWQKAGPFLLLLSLVLLLLVLIPFIGHEVKGSRRWIPLGIVNLQPSEFAKIAMLIYLSGYVTRKKEEIQTQWQGFLKPVGVLMLMVVLLLLEPDFGSVVVLMIAALAVLFLAGVHLSRFIALLALSIALVSVLAVSQPYRVARIKSFLEPWEHQFSSGYQLTQSLIAFGRGEWFGVGLGNSIQKLFYLPEAHTDFVFAVIAEETGLLGNLLVLGGFGALFVVGLLIGRRAQLLGNLFSAYLAYGLCILISVQALFNLGVNMGLLPTKGLTLPLMSYGGSSMLASCITLALLARIEKESQLCLERMPSKRAANIRKGIVKNKEKRKSAKKASIKSKRNSTTRKPLVSA